MIKIPLYSKKYSELVALIDDEDFDLINQYHWNLRWYPSQKTFYALGYVLGTRSRIRMHRLILSVPFGMDIDHRDHNGLNNQKSNIRICTRSQNMANVRKHKGVSRFKGVSWFKRDKKWQSSIMLNQKSIHLGLFDNEIDAAKIYDGKAIELFGEYANTNFEYQQVQDMHWFNARK